MEEFLEERTERLKLKKLWAEKHPMSFKFFSNVQSNEWRGEPSVVVTKVYRCLERRNFWCLSRFTQSFFCQRLARAIILWLDWQDSWFGGCLATKKTQHTALLKKSQKKQCGAPCVFRPKKTRLVWSEPKDALICFILVHRSFSLL